MKMGKYIYNISVTALFAAIIAVCAWISVPVGPVPFTLQTLGVLCAGGLLGYKRGVASVITYIALGAVGLPVFNGFSGGIGVILGSTGGYIIGFILTAFITGFAADKYSRKPVPVIIAMIIGVIACYLVGTIWFMVVYTVKAGAIALSTVLLNCVVPFILPDALKIAVSFIIVLRVSRHVKV